MTAAPPAVVIDTDILSALMRRHPTASARAKAYLAAHGQFTFSIITRYEILRGLRAKGATKQLAAFDLFCTSNRVLPLKDGIIVRASEIYADLYGRGQLISDADILIAATALFHGHGVVINNEKHFRRVAGLGVDNWLR